jgi:hypothetical protein
MYGYSFACAKADVWHATPSGMMLYPGYDARSSPYVLHYGLLWHVGEGYSFDKHWHYDFDPFLCPPWNVTEIPSRVNGKGSTTGGTWATSRMDCVAFVNLCVTILIRSYRRTVSAPPVAVVLLEHGI